MELGSLATNDLTRNPSANRTRDPQYGRNMGDAYNVPGTYNLKGERILQDPTARQQPSSSRGGSKPKQQKPRHAAGFAI